MVQDYTTIKNPRFIARAEMHHPFPDWVVNQSMPSSSDFVKKASTAFADPARRLLPICTKSAAFHSAINLFARMEEFDETVFERVKAACESYGIEADVAPYAALFADEQEKSASLAELQEGRYALRETIGGQHFDLFPINDADDVINSAGDIAKMASENRIPIVLFVSAAREIVKAAEDHNVLARLPALVARFGEERYPDQETAQRLIAGREQFCKNADIRDEVAKEYAAAVNGISEDPEAAMLKIAAIDTVAEIAPNYKVSSLVPTAYDIVFGGPVVREVEKAAKEHLLVKDVAIPMGEVQRISEMDAQYKLSKSAAEEFMKLRDSGDARDLSVAVESWTDTDQRTLLRMAVHAAK